jgi:hypothetical protein
MGLGLARKSVTLSAAKGPLFPLPLNSANLAESGLVAESILSKPKGSSE